MKRIVFALCLIVILLSACLPPSTNTTPAPVESEVPWPSSTQTAMATESPATLPMPNPKLPASSFESRTYIDDTTGFALDYPAEWTVDEAVAGPRGSQVQFLSSPDLGNTSVLPEGATRLSATVYQWDPKNDLAAFVENQKTAWNASGFSILEEQALTLELGLPAMQFTVRMPEAQVFF